MNFPLSIWLKQHRRGVGGVLLASAIASCHAPAQSQPPAANTPSIASSSIASSPTSLPVSLSQSAASAAGSTFIEIPVTVTAITKNGTWQRFRGSYVLRRVNDVPGSTPEQRRWHLYSAHISQVN